MNVWIIHDEDGQIEAVFAANTPKGVTLKPADTSGRLVSELQSHSVGDARGEELVSKLREIKNSKLSDLKTRQT